MATTTPLASGISSAASVTETRVVHQTYALLRFLLGIVPIVAGADKFANILAHWETYLSPITLRLLPLSATTFMHVVGVIEIVAGILVFAKPRLGAAVVTAWLLAIAFQLLIGGHYFDVAVRDIVIALTGSLTLARLAPLVSHGSDSV